MRRSQAIVPVSTGTDAAEARQGGAIGADQEDRLDQIAARLLDRQRGKVGIVKRPLGHHPVDGQRQLLADLRDGQLRNARIAAPFLGQPGMGVVDGLLAPLDGHIHQDIRRAARQAGEPVAAGEQVIEAQRKQPRIGLEWRGLGQGQRRGVPDAGAAKRGAGRAKRRPPRRSAWRSGRGIRACRWERAGGAGPPTCQARSARPAAPQTARRSGT